MNLPNKLSVARIIAVPLMLVAYYLPLPLAPLWSVGIFVIAAFTDFLDGHIARKYNMVTDLGKLLDPIADKMLVIFALFIVIENDVLLDGIGAAACGIIVAREILIGIVRQIAASKGKIIQANGFGKIKTIFQDISLPLLMVIPIVTTTVWGNVFRIVSYVLFGIAVFFTILSLIIYLVQNRSVFSEDKK